MHNIKKILDCIFCVSESVSKILLCVVFVVMWIVVFGRYLFKYTPMWSEDLMLFAMCWLCMLSGAEAFRRDAHLKITVFQDMLPDKPRQVLKVIIDILTCAFFAYMIRAGFEEVLLNVEVFYTGLKISKMWLFLCFPISFILTILAKIDKYIIAYEERQHLKEEMGESK